MIKEHTPKHRKRVSYELPDDLTEALDGAAQKIGIKRNAALILAARKGIDSLVREFAPAHATA